MKIYKLKPLEWFKLNTFKDDDGDYWESEYYFNEWSNDMNKGNLKYIDSGAVQLEVLNIDKDFIMVTQVDWGTEYEITRETYPEYFL